jgi:hypothetical protein
MINTKVDRENLFVNLNRLNLVKKIVELVTKGGYYARPEDGKFVPRLPGAPLDAPWVYVKVHQQLRCDVYHRVLFKFFKIVPSTCRSCWKIVVMPRTVVELFDLYELQKDMGVPCKCGIEKRRTDTRLYGGYFYTQGEAEGLERYKQVRKLVNSHLSKATPVILKRYCSEYEIGDGVDKGLGPSDELPDLTEDEIWMENYVLSNFPAVGYGLPQPDHIVANTMMEWIHYAFKHGDDMYKAFTDGSPLFPSCVTYHEKEK